MNATFSTRARNRALLLAPLAAMARLAPLDSLAAQSSDISPAKITQPMTIVVGGLDTRQPTQPENSDVLMISRVDLANSTLRAISIPRDLFVTIPGVGSDKITRAYDYGSNVDGNGTRDEKAGVALMEQTIAANFGVTVKGAAITDFDGLKAIVNAFGGVDVNNPYEVYDAQYPTEDYGTTVIDFPAGPVHLNGDEALEFCRTRHQDGDDGRIMRQHLVLAALLAKAHDSSIAPKLGDLVNAYRKYVYTSLSRAVQLALVLAVPSFKSSGLLFADLTNSGYLYPDTGPGGAWIYSADWDQVPGYVEGFLNGSITPSS